MSHAQLRCLPRLFAVLLLLLAAIITTTVVTATPAEAVGCYANGCNGKDPSVQGCGADARTIDEFTFGARFELRYSPACFAAWTRVTSSTHYNTIFGQIRAHNSIGSPAVLVYGVQATQGQHWTKMASFTYWVRSCRSIWFNADPIECTAYH